MTRTSVASSRIATVSIVLGDGLPLLVDRGHLVEDLLLELVRGRPAVCATFASAVCAARPRRGLAVLRGDRADRVRDRPRVRLPPKRAPSTAPGAGDQLVRLARLRLGVELLDAPLGERERLSSRSPSSRAAPSSFAVSASAPPGRPRRSGRGTPPWSRPGGTSASAPVAEDLERAVRDEPLLDVLAAGEEPRVGDRRGRQHVGRAGGPRARSRGRRSRPAARCRGRGPIERAVDRLELLLLVDAAAVSSYRSATRVATNACRRGDRRRLPDLRRPRGGGVEVRDGDAAATAGATVVSSSASVGC